MKSLLLLALALVAMCHPAMAKFMMPQQIPVERLLENAQKHLDAHPASDEARYILARIHYLAFTYQDTSVPALRDEDSSGKPLLAPNWMTQRKTTGSLDPAKLASHAEHALTGFEALVKKHPSDALYQLGLASLLEQIADWKDAAKPADLSAPLQAVTRDQARDTYLAAFRAGIAEEAALQHQPISGINSLVSYEAGQAFLRIAKAPTDAAPDLNAAIAEVEKGLKKIEALPRSPAITPMIFSLTPTDTIDDLLTPDTLVDFDLRGYGPPQRVCWLKPATALLVWDPEKIAQITSGHQLFGGYTFQIFRNNGYDALAALDDDGNGILQGNELTGIRAWFDANGDAVSTTAEVRDLAELGIIGIRTNPTGHEGPHPTATHGLILRDGSTLPTWDWTTQPLVE
jgi:hypothetical protein